MESSYRHDSFRIRLSTAQIYSFRMQHRWWTTQLMVQHPEGITGDNRGSFLEEEYQGKNEEATIAIL